MLLLHKGDGGPFDRPTGKENHLIEHDESMNIFCVVVPSQESLLSIPEKRNQSSVPPSGKDFSDPLVEF